MIVSLVFYLAMVICLATAVIYFRDLGDIPQLVIKTKRSNVDRFIRYEYLYLCIGAGAGIVSAIAHLGFDAGYGPVFWIATVIFWLVVAFTWIYVHLGLRSQKDRAR